MKPPGAGLPDRLPEHHPHERERYEEDEQAVRDAVRSMDIRRDERGVRGFLSKVRTFSKAEERGDEKRTEGKQVRKDAEEKRQPEIPPVCSSEGNPAPEPM